MINDLIDWFSSSATWQEIPQRVGEHALYTVVALVIAAAIAIPLGMFVGHSGRGGVALVGSSNVIRSLPTLGLVTFLFLLLTQAQPAVYIALVVLAIPPILAGTYAGVAEADRAVVDAAAGMGMTGWQRLLQVEVPIALPLLLGGIRNATLQIVATAAVGAYVGLGGLGRFVLDGLSIYDYGEVAGGAVLTALLAIAFDLVLAGIGKVVVPKGLRLTLAATGAAAKGGASA